MRQMRADFSRVTMPAHVREAEEILHQGVRAFSPEQKMAFLLRNSKAVERAGWQTTARTIETRLTSLSSSQIDEKTDQVAKLLHNQALGPALKSIDRNTKKYFEARGLPLKTEIERDALGIAVDKFVRTHKLRDFSRGVDLAGIERDFLQIRRGLKFTDQETAEEQNRLLKDIFKGERLTPNQRRAAKRWLKQNYKQFRERRKQVIRDILTHYGGKFPPGSSDEIRQKFAEIQLELGVRARKELLKSFKQAITKRAPQARVIREPVSKKPGTRRERIAAYQPAIREKAERSRDLAIGESVTRLVGGTFDPVSDVLRRIEEESPPTASKLRELMDQRLLEGNLVKSLFINGSLAQKVFLTAIADPNFSRFGPKAINLAAKGITFIGPGGKPIGRARRAFQGEIGKKLFDFLETKGLIETGHGGGTVVYLARNP